MLAGENAAEIYFLSFDADSAAVGYENRFVVKGIIDFGQTAVGSRRGSINFAREFHIKSLMGALGVVTFQELIELGLLLKDILARRFRGFLLKREMHAFVSSVLLGMTGLDAFDLDSEAQPPDGKLAQVIQGVGRSEWDAVIGADGRRESPFLENALKDGHGVGFFGVLQTFAGQKKAAGEISDGERITVAGISQSKLALVIRAPKFVGLFSGGKRGPLGLETPAGSSMDEVMAIQDGVDGALGGRPKVGVTADQDLSDLGCSPAGLVLSDLNDRVLHLNRKLVRLAVGSTAAVGEALDPDISVAVPNLIAGLPGDAEFAA
jgi:hypothetical protein